jgi:DNA-binding beta-propeller fold protein YncE
MKKLNKYTLLLGWVVAISLTACRKEASQLPAEEVQIGAGSSGAIKGLYVLNEGNMGTNKASLDYYDYTTGTYRRNIFGETNPNVVLGLGDVGNDIAIYGTKMYVVINGSNQVMVLNARTAKRIKEISVPNCRYIKFYKDKAYITSYEGYVAVADTTLLNVQTTIKVGRQPEQMAVVGSKMYVANSGGYTPPNYDRTVSVIDLNTNTVVKNIDVAINLNRVAADQYGDVYVTSRGDYYDITPKLFVIDTQTDVVKKQFDIPASELVIHNDLAYIYSVADNYNTGQSTVKYALLDVKTETLLNRSFITDGTGQDIKLPYGLAVDPITEDVYLTDARDYVSSGILYCYDKTGKKKWSVTTGDIPAHLAFLY